MYPTVQNVFNSARYYAETGQTASDIPGVPSGGFPRALIPPLVIVAVLWILERGRLGIGFKFGAKG